MAATRMPATALGQKDMRGAVVGSARGPRDHQAIELAEDGEGRPVARAARHLRAHAREGQTRAGREAEASQRLLDAAGRADLLEAELRRAPDILAESDDLVDAAINRVMDPPLQLLFGHRRPPTRPCLDSRSVRGHDTNFRGDSATSFDNGGPA